MEEPLQRRNFDRSAVKVGTKKWARRMETDGWERASGDRKGDDDENAARSGSLDGGRDRRILRVGPGTVVSGRGKRWGVRRASVAVGFAFQMFEDLSYDSRLGDESSHAQLAAAGTQKWVELEGDRFILHLLQWVRSGRGYLVVDAASYQRPMALVDRFGADQKATGLDRCPCERG